MKLTKTKIKILAEITIILSLFLFVSFITQHYSQGIRSFIGDGILGMLLYIFMLIVSTVFAPMSTLPLLPLGSQLFGWFIAGFLNVIGWFIGGMIAFLLARRYGRPLIVRFTSSQRLALLEKYIPQQDYFFSIVLLQIFIPTDILSYALGLFSKVHFRIYSAATLVGLIPFAFILAYFGSVSLPYQILFIILTACFFSAAYFIVEKTHLFQIK